MLSVDAKAPHRTGRKGFFVMIEQTKNAKRIVVKTSSELGLVRQLSRRVRVGVEVAIVAAFHGVHGVALLNEGDVRVFADFARHGLYEVHRLNFCHSFLELRILN